MKWANERTYVCVGARMLGRQLTDRWSELRFHGLNACLLDPYVSNVVNSLHATLPAAHEWGSSWASVDVHGVSARIRAPHTALTRENALIVNTFTTFEGTSEIQRLIIARAISGVHVK